MAERAQQAYDRIVAEQAEPLASTAEEVIERAIAAMGGREALYSYDQDGMVQPQLATECVPNDDLSLWTCSLRQGVTFHDGSTFDANDVVVSFTAGLDYASPLHTGNSGIFDYYDYLWHGLINKPAEE